MNGLPTDNQEIQVLLGEEIQELTFLLISSIIKFQINTILQNI